MSKDTLQGTNQARDALLTNELWGNLPSIKQRLQSNSGGYSESSQVKSNTWHQLDWVNGDTVYQTSDNAERQ